MIEALNTFQNPKLQSQLIAKIEEIYIEVKVLLPELPDPLKIYFSNDFLYEVTGVGGFAYDHDIVTVSFDENFADKKKQDNELRGTLFHEFYHIAHGYHSQQEKVTALHVAIYEGAANVFQRDVAGISWVGQYDSDKEMMEWVTKIATLSKDFDWYKWKVHDEESGKSAILYSVGTFIVDKALQKSRLTIFDLRHKSADEILKMANL